MYRKHTNLCAKMAPNNTPIQFRKIGGPRNVCGKQLGHIGPHGDWIRMSQVEHARAARLGEYRVIVQEGFDDGD